MSDDVTTILASAIRLSVPLGFAGVGEYIAERAGTLNISVEAMMLCGAYGGAVGSSVSHNAALGFLWGMAAGLVVAVIHANFSHRLQANTFVVGLTLNVLALGLTNYLLEKVAMTPRQVGVWKVPLLWRIPVVGKPLFAERWPAYLLFAIVPVVWWVMQRSRWGLEMRSVGENPKAADVTGIHVNKRRRQGLYVCGIMAGFGGAYLSIAEVGTFNSNMTAGRGFIVIAAVIFGGWTLLGTLGGCFLFGGVDALRLALPALGYTINPELLIAAPYLIALLALCFFAKRLRQPAALAQPFERGAA
ncbi:MAG TPA: ABC transporter permease [Acidimicrobiales bacterium]|nr:ABC transporter permease [Acidimicrobiales bacterium]